MWPISNEAASNVKALLSSRLPAPALQQIQSVATDEPSWNFFTQLQEICPNLVWLNLDPVHLALVYNSAHWHKRTPGQSVLRLAVILVAGCIVMFSFMLPVCQLSFEYV